MGAESGESVKGGELWVVESEDLDNREAGGL